jgi:rubredoxin
MSHLSDVQDTMYDNNAENKNYKINFCKYIILKCKGDLNQNIDPDKMWKEFSKEFYTMKLNYEQ